MAYMKREFCFTHFTEARPEDPLHLHAYEVKQRNSVPSLALSERLSTDAAGTATALGLRADTDISLDDITQTLEGKIGDETMLAPVKR